MVSNVQRVLYSVLLTFILCEVSKISQLKLNFQNFNENFSPKGYKMSVYRYDFSSNFKFCNFTTNATTVSDGLLISSEGMMFQDLQKFLVSPSCM